MNTIIILNNKDCDNSGKEISSLVIVAPNQITNKQYAYLEYEKERLENFVEKNIGFLDLFDPNEDFSITDNFYQLENFYQHFERIMTSQTTSKK